MLKNLFGYPVILAATVYIGILNRQSWTILLFFAELFLFLFQVLAVIYQKMHLFLDVTMPQPALLGEEQAVAEVSLKNYGMLPVQKLKILAEYQHLASSERAGYAKENVSVWGRVDSEDTQSYEILSGPFPGGQFLISIPYIRIYDYFGIFSIKIKVGKSQAITILPEFVTMPVVLSGRESPVEGESDSTKIGQDPTEIYDIREYQAGDSLRKIYWKRSAGRETVLYRENAGQKGAAAVLFLQFPEKPEPVRLHYAITIAGSFMFSLLQGGYLHFLVWEDTQADRLERRLVANEQDLYEAVLELLNREMGRETRKERRKQKRGKGKRKELT